VRRRAKSILSVVISQCEAALETSNPAPAIRSAVRDGLVALGDLGEDDPSTQLRDLAFEAERIEVLGVERVRSRLAFARAVLKL